MGAAFLERGRRVLGRKHAGKNGIMRAFDARDIDKPRGAANERATRKGELWHGLEAAFGNRAGAKAEPLRALKQGRNGWVSLEALKFVKRRKRGICVVEVNDEAYGNERIFEMIEKGAAARAVVERPAEGMLDKTRTVQRRVDPPEFLESNAEFLRLAVFVESETGNELLGERATRAL